MSSIQYCHLILLMFKNCCVKLWKITFAVVLVILQFSFIHNSRVPFTENCGMSCNKIVQWFDTSCLWVLYGYFNYAFIFLLSVCILCVLLLWSFVSKNLHDDDDSSGCRLAQGRLFAYLLVHNCVPVFSSDNDIGDINREVKRLFVRVNVLIRRLSYCSVKVKMTWNCSITTVYVFMTQHF